MKRILTLLLAFLPLCAIAQIIKNPSKTSYLVEVFVGKKKLHSHVMAPGDSFTIHKTTCTSKNITLTYRIHEFHCDKIEKWALIRQDDRNIQLPKIGSETKIILLKPCIYRDSGCGCGRGKQGLWYLTIYHLPYNDCKIP